MPRSGATLAVDDDVVARLKAPPSDAERRAWRRFTADEVARRARVRDGWIVVRERVFDVTAFVSSHPGFHNAGQVSTAIAIARALGTDATEAFEATHSRRAWTQLGDFQIGVLAREGERAEGEGSEEVVTPVPDWLEGDVTFGGRFRRATDAQLRFLETAFGLPQGLEAESETVVAEVSVRESDGKSARGVGGGRGRGGWIALAWGVMAALGVAESRRRATRTRDGRARVASVVV